MKSVQKPLKLLSKPEWERVQTLMGSHFSRHWGRWCQKTSPKLISQHWQPHWRCQPWFLQGMTKDSSSKERLWQWWLIQNVFTWQIWRWWRNFSPVCSVGLTVQCYCYDTPRISRVGSLTGWSGLTDMKRKPWSIFFLQFLPQRHSEILKSSFCGLVSWTLNLWHRKSQLLLIEKSLSISQK